MGILFGEPAEEMTYEEALKLAIETMSEVPDLIILYHKPDANPPFVAMRVSVPDYKRNLLDYLAWVVALMENARTIQQNNMKAVFHWGQVEDEKMNQKGRDDPAVR